MFDCPSLISYNPFRYSYVFNCVKRLHDDIKRQLTISAAHESAVNHKVFFKGRLFQPLIRIVISDEIIIVSLSFYNARGKLAEI
jgi:hypothetical protein